MIYITQNIISAMKTRIAELTNIPISDDVYAAIFSRFNVVDDTAASSKLVKPHLIKDIEINTLIFLLSKPNFTASTREIAHIAEAHDCRNLIKLGLISQTPKITKFYLAEIFTLPNQPVMNDEINTEIDMKTTSSDDSNEYDDLALTDASAEPMDTDEAQPLDYDCDIMDFRIDMDVDDASEPTPQEPILTELQKCWANNFYLEINTHGNRYFQHVLCANNKFTLFTHVAPIAYSVIENDVTATMSVEEKNNFIDSFFA